MLGGEISDDGDQLQPAPTVAPGVVTGETVVLVRTTDVWEVKGADLSHRYWPPGSSPAGGISCARSSARGPDERRGRGDVMRSRHRRAKQRR